MKILVVGGASGHVAGALSRISAADLDIEVCGRPQVDLAIPESLKSAVENSRPQVVICAGAYTAVDTAEEQTGTAMQINAAGPMALAHTCSTAGVPLVHLSTDYVFNGEKGDPYVETDSTDPISVYGYTKSLGEQGVIGAGGRHVILRISGVYAQRGKNFVRTMLRLAKTQSEIGVVDDQWGRPTYAADVADALVALARHVGQNVDAPSGVFHMTGQGDICTWRAFADAIFAASAHRGGPTARVKPITSAEYPTPARRPAYSALDCSLVAAAFGVRLPEWRASLANCIDRIAASNWDVS